MIIDRGHLAWGVATGLLAAASTALYIAYARAAPAGPSGGSWQGLAFGAAGFSLMTFAALLGARRRVRTWRLGRASTWLKGHLWLGLLSVPLILYHGGLARGGPLTTTLLVLLFLVVGSGLAGIVIQQVLPRLMSETIPLETIYDEIPHVCEQLRAEADRLVDAAEFAPLREIYLSRLRPHLAYEGPGDPEMARRNSAAGLFERMRVLVPPALTESVDDLADIWEERRQLRAQERLHRMLHSWLFVHVPLTMAIMVLSVFHALWAIRY